MSHSPVTGEEREALVRYWTGLGLSSRVARLLANEGYRDLTTLRGTSRWILIPRFGRKAAWEVFHLINGGETASDER